MNFVNCFTKLSNPLYNHPYNYNIFEFYIIMGKFIHKRLYAIRRIFYTGTEPKGEYFIRKKRILLLHSICSMFEFTFDIIYCLLRKENTFHHRSEVIWPNNFPIAIEKQMALKEPVHPNY